MSHTRAHYSTLQRTATHCNTRQHTAAHGDSCNTFLLCHICVHSTTYCNTLQHTATHCITRRLMQHLSLMSRKSASQFTSGSYISESCHVAHPSHELYCVATCCNVLRCVAVSCNDLKFVAVLLGWLVRHLLRDLRHVICHSCTATHCNTRATHCNTQQYTTTHCNTL